jgi:hypothetical protein
MIFTTQTIATWDPAITYSVEFRAARNNLIGDFVVAANTDGEVTQLTESSWQRKWVDVISAEAYKTSLVALAAQFNLALTSVVVSPITPIDQAPPVVV